MTDAVVTATTASPPEEPVRIGDAVAGQCDQAFRTIAWDKASPCGFFGVVVHLGREGFNERESAVALAIAPTRFQTPGAGTAIVRTVSGAIRTLPLEWVRRLKECLAASAEEFPCGEK